MSKIKTYNIMLSTVFPVTHPKAGQETGFKPKVLAALNDTPCYLKKLHTIRANYELWKKRFDEVDGGYAVINLRQWLGRPYRSKTVLIKKLTSEDGIGIQKLNIVEERYKSRSIIMCFVDDSLKNCLLPTLAANDGLSVSDWLAWFKGYDKTKPLAIIHFTDFRYE